MFMRKKMRDYLAAIYDSSKPAHESYLTRLLAEDLITEKEAEAIRHAGDAARRKVVIGPRNGCIGTFTWTDWNSRTT